MTRFASRALLVLAIAFPGIAAAQGVTLPPDGANQKASVSQWIGLVEVNVTYNSPKVTAPDGTDRRGKIWGQLVPYGLHKEAYGTCGDGCPWRAGANENTVFRVSHDVKVEGKPLAAGSYGLHVIPGADEWTFIFSKSYKAWGSFFYDAKDDALRVSVKPRKAPYRHWLTYEFVERQPDKATLVLGWEELEAPIGIAVDDVTGLYVASLRQELKGATGQYPDSWSSAARYCLDKKTNLPEALKWAEYAVNANFVGVANFQTLSTLADLQAANGMAAESAKSMKRALESPTATVFDIHGYGRRLLAEGKKAEALEAFQLNAKRNPNVWPVNVGLARGYSAVGKTKEALAAAKAALAQAPDDVNRENLRKMIAKLETGKDAN